ncbi:MAG: protein kinase [Chloroflexota bacterium]
MMTNSINQHNTIHNRYHLHEKLGQGGMGEVYRATDRLTGDVVALKRVLNLPTHNQRGTSPTSVDDLRLALAHEFQTLAGLRHPHIISVLDYGFDQKRQPFFTMTYLSASQNILDAAQNTSFEHKIELIQQLLQALAYLHRRGVLHRDLKPDNVLVSNGVVRVLDFGLSASDQLRGSNSAGTPLYMAPELFEGQDYSPMADLYAVGVLFYQLLTNEHPFAPFDFQFLDRVLEEEPDWAGVDLRVQPILTQLLAKAAEERFASAADVITALAEAVGQPIPPETAAIRESYLQAATFVGREQELTCLLAALQQAQSGEGSAWLIGGESGVGKTRLMDELHTQALVSGFFVLRGQTVDDSTMPYGVWRTPLRQLVIDLAHIEDLTASILLPLVPDIAQLIGRPVHPAPELNSTADQARLFTTLSRLFHQLNRPVLLMLEDLHWADISLLPLPYLTRQIDTKQLLILATYRNDERPDLPDAVPEMTTLSLERLSPQEMAELSVAMLGEAGKRDDIQTLLQAETEGNAFFAVEVVRSLAASAGHLDNIGEMVLPQQIITNGIWGIVEQRLNRLPMWARQLLVKAAVAGRELDVSLMSTLHRGRDIEHEWLPLCTDAAVLEFRNQGWQFNHDKIRDGVLMALEPHEKRVLHEEVATAIEQLYPEDVSQAGRLALHWQEAGHTAKERQYAELAGKQAWLNYAYQDALRYYARALELAPPNDWEKRYDLYRECEDCSIYTGDLANQVDALAQMRICADRLDSDTKRIETLLRYAIYYQRHRHYDSLEKTVEKGILLAKKMGDIEHEFRLLDKWTLALGENRQLEEAFQRLAQCKELVGRSDNIALQLQFLMASAHLHFYANDVARALPFEKEYLRLAEEHNLLFPIFRGSANMGVSYQTRGEYDLAERYYGRALEIARERGDIGSEVFVQVNLTDFYNIIGEFDFALDTGNNALNNSQQIGRANFYRIALLGVGLAHHKLGDMDKAEALLVDGIDLCQQASDSWNEVVGWLRLGHLNIDQDQFTEALNAFEKAEALQTDMDQTAILAETWAGLAAASIGLGDVEHAKRYAEKALAHMHPEKIDDGWAWARAYFYVGYILNQSQDERAATVIQQALHARDIRANQIADETRRQTYLSEVSENRMIGVLYELIADS